MVAGKRLSHGLQQLNPVLPAGGEVLAVGDIVVLPVHVQHGLSEGADSIVGDGHGGRGGAGVHAIGRCLGVRHPGEG
jgi:hypothetical protein